MSRFCFVGCSLFSLVIKMWVHQMFSSKSAIPSLGYIRILLACICWEMERWKEIKERKERAQCDHSWTKAVCLLSLLIVLFPLLETQYTCEPPFSPPAPVSWLSQPLIFPHTPPPTTSHQILMAQPVRSILQFTSSCPRPLPSSSLSCTPATGS